MIKIVSRILVAGISLIVGSFLVFESGSCNVGLIFEDVFLIFNNFGVPSPTGWLIF